MCVCVCNNKSLGLWPGDRQSYTVDINTIIQGYTLSQNRHLEDGESFLAASSYVDKMLAQLDQNQTGKQIPFFSMWWPNL